MCMSQHICTPCPAPFLLTDCRTARVFPGPSPVCVACVLCVVCACVWGPAVLSASSSHPKAPPHKNCCMHAVSVRCTRALWVAWYMVARRRVEGGCSPTLTPPVIGSTAARGGMFHGSNERAFRSVRHTKGFSLLGGQTLLWAGTRGCGGLCGPACMQLIRNTVLQRRAEAGVACYGPDTLASTSSSGHPPHVLEFQSPRSEPSRSFWSRRSDGRGHSCHISPLVGGFSPR